MSTYRESGVDIGAGDRACEVRRLPEASKRDATRHRFQNLLTSSHRALEQGGLGRPGADDVHIDVVRCQFAGERF